MNSWLRRGFTVTCITCCLIALSGCAGYGPTDSLLGKDRKAVIELLGAPTSERALNQGSQLEYAKGPQGKHTFFVTLGPNGTVTSWDQVLHWKSFEKIKPGMSQDEVLALIGKSYLIVRLARNWGEVWSYRYETPFCVWFQIEFTAEGKVRSAGDGIPFECLIDSP